MFSKLKGIRRYHFFEHLNSDGTIPSKHNGAVTAYVTKGKVAFAFCSPKDQFSRKKGQIALERLLTMEYGQKKFVKKVKNYKPEDMMGEGYIHPQEDADFWTIVEAYEKLPDKPRYLPKKIEDWEIIK